MTQIKLNKLTAQWQKRLRIQDWDISVQILNHGDFIKQAGFDALGACSCHSTKKQASIIIMHPNEHDEDVESVLIHELLHVVMPVQDLNIKVDDNDSVYIAYERIVDQMAHTLRAAYEDA